MRELLRCQRVGSKTVAPNKGELHEWWDDDVTALYWSHVIWMDVDTGVSREDLFKDTVGDLEV